MWALVGTGSSNEHYFGDPSIGEGSPFPHEGAKVPHACALALQRREGGLDWENIVPGGVSSQVCTDSAQL